MPRLTGTISRPIQISAGESLDVEVEWKNEDGSARTMAGHTVTAKVWTQDRRKLYETTLGSPSMISIDESVTAQWPSKQTYRLELWDTDGSTVLTWPFSFTVTD
jgi:hypothetical protein